MSIIAQLANVLNGVTCSDTCSKAFRAYIHGIGTVVNGSNSALQILCRGKQLKFCHRHSILLMSYGVS